MPSADYSCPAARPGAPTDRNAQRIPFVANIKSQIKRNRTNELDRQRNKAVRSQLKTKVKAAEKAVGDDAEAALAAATAAVSVIDRAATKGVIHKNAAARKKSRLAKRLANLAAETDSK
jgi:small subunit ribosomal protein S20